ncbi:type II toxin-antitoxin system RatA family toxin [Yinghuangia soli]|uniref:SRPBCC family protein n=1 Tax=Yinghuangia soli TaxID=2908204 RepID=A0AA41PZP3_9ACTN|nr:SRPBCC family protein [Yinghuangia soli]MCF2528850.1 SRPBCC family protein [Yinghuangia soli]
MECSVVLDARLSGQDPDTVFALVADFEQYPRLTENVRAVQILHRGAGSTESTESSESTWEVTFRRGILVWTERDEIDAAARRIEFTQTKGDFAKFTGTWTVEPDAAGTVVGFASRFDLGIASLASLVDPVACAALRDSISDILRGLFGAEIEITEIEAAPVTA